MNKKRTVKAEPSVVESGLVKPLRAKKAARASVSSAGSNGSPVVVGIGASAGGLEAFSKLLAALPLDTGMAFVLVQHLDPTHESLLTELLGRTTGLKVTEIIDGLSVQANHVFVIPPTANLTIKHGVLHLSPRVPGRGSHSSIDDFMASLALDLSHRAIGVVLSGTASDGTLGLEAIKAEGGITFAQDPKSARFDAMPRSVIAAGVVDFVLPPEQIAVELARLAKEPYLGQAIVAKIKKGSGLATSETTSSETEPCEAMPDPKGFERILALLHDARGVDFSMYRASTVRRRIDRRMMLDGISSAPEYAQRLRENPKELEALYHDLLIGVTSFFRDPHAFECLQREVFPGLVKDRTADKSVRIWVSGCSTGQEAYSMAMAFLEFTAKAGINVPVQIFATDLNDATLERARAGLYANNLLQNVSKERLKRFFTEEPDGYYRISKSVREMVVFARQNVFADPPFSRLDLISCRNLLIYLDPLLQARVIPTFHHALKAGGVLLLGASETVGRFTDLFATLDNRCRLYIKIAGTSRIPRLDSRSSVPTAKPRAERAGTVVEASSLDTQREADRLLLSRYAPSGVVVDDALEIVQFRGATGQFLEPSTGKASFNLLRMAREGLMLPLRTLTERARQENRAVRLDGVRYLHDGHGMTINLEVVPLKRPGCLLVLFEVPHEAPGVESAEPNATKTKTKSRDETRHIEDLTREVLEVREYLRMVQEQHEDASDQLQATNEELQSSSEEFQSLNEELETAKEELESANEEMQTLNDELMGRNVELARVNGDLNNFQVSAKLSLVSIGTDLNVRRYTPQAETTLRLRAADIGHPIGHLRHHFDPEDLPDLEALVSEVMRTGILCEREVRDHDGCWFLLRIRAYTTLEGNQDGAVLVLFGIDKLKIAELERERLQQETEAVFESLESGLIGISHDWTITFFNTAGLRLTRNERETTIGKNFWELFPERPGALYPINYRRSMTERIKMSFEEYYPPLETQFEIRVTPVAAGITVFFRDVTARHRSEVIVEEAQAQLRALAESQRRFLADAAHELRAPLAVIQGNLEILERYPNMSLDERQEAVGESARESARLGRLANDLLSLARGDAGDALQLEPLELAPILEETLRDAERLAAGRHLEPGVLEPCKILGNPDKLKQLALILLDNALKYTPDGGRVTLELHRQDTHAEFRIVNTGPAISPEDLEHVFERFYRTDASRSRQTGGTGLGLPIARWIAGQHGGTIKLMSDTDVGTTVIVRLPLAHDAG